MSFKLNNSQQITLNDSFLQQTERTQKYVKESWAGAFADYVFSAINEERFSCLYSDNDASRPGTPVNIVIGALLLKELRNLSDKELMGSIYCDVRFQYALHTTSYEEQPISNRTFSRFRVKLEEHQLETGEDLLSDEIRHLTDVYADHMNLTSNIKRMDSLMIASRSKRMSRLEIIYQTTANAIRLIHRLGNDGMIPANLFHYLEADDHNQVIYYCKGEDVTPRLEKAIAEAVAVKDLMEDDLWHEFDEYKLLVRVIEEQSKEKAVNSETTDSRSIPDAGVSSPDGKSDDGVAAPSPENESASEDAAAETASAADENESAKTPQEETSIQGICAPTNSASVEGISIEESHAEETADAGEAGNPAGKETPARVDASAVTDNATENPSEAALSADECRPADESAVPNVEKESSDPAAEETVRVPKDNKEISPNSLQNPSDPDATYREKAGKKHKGYVGNITETVGENGDSLITDFSFEQNTHSDSDFLREYLEKRPDDAEQETVIADGAYGGEENQKLAGEKNVNLVPTALTGKVTGKVFSSFKLSEDGTIVTSCPKGFAPVKCSHYKNGMCRAQFSKDCCANCPNREACHAKEQKKTFVVVVSASMVARANYMEKLSTEKYKKLTRMRNAVEGVMSVLRRKYRIDEIPAYGKTRTMQYATLKIGAYNFNKFLKHVCRTREKSAQNLAIA